MIEEFSEQEQHQINGRHCYIKYLSTRRRGNYLLSDAEYGYQSVGLPHGTEEEKIAFFISALPDAKLLDGGKNFGCGVLQAWVGYKDACVNIAKCFLSTKGEVDDPLLPLLGKGEIDKWAYEYKWLEAYLYKNLWHLICDNSRLITLNLDKNWGYPFTSIADLLCEIVRGDIEGEFSRYLLSSYEYKGWEIDQIDKLKRKMHKDKFPEGEKEIEEEKKFWALIDKNSAKAIWYDRVIAIAYELADRGVDKIKTYLDINSNNIDAMARLRIKSSRDPALKSHRRKSHYCVEGVITEGTLRQKWKDRKA
ncbi:MAG: hypothetical protein RMX68_001725 [Aulosira sp. ZfuVER01]|nr:hypothetical protein [Aulosira sp. ZfuVER01]MDZ8001695.1 hypothetical protein [Aulosira sp. DedVER01a]MDZ8055203.1 hypothetical protein [Aulosira sp. ZfuCHP01]